MRFRQLITGHLFLLMIVASTGACRGLAEPPGPLPPPPPETERTADERMEEASTVIHRMNRVQARAGRLEPGTIADARLPDFGMLRRDEGIRLMMRDVGRAAEGTGWAAGRVRDLMRDPQMMDDPEMRLHLERISEHLSALASRLEMGLADLEGMRERLYTR